MADPADTQPNVSYTVKHITQYCDALIPLVQNAPDLLLSLPQFPRIALEKWNASGGKYWLIVAMETGVSIRWGKLGRNGTVKHIALSRCARKNPALELKERVLAKLRNGYDIIPHETILP